jgi:thiol:disulfide interchange protein DsbA
MARIKTGIPKNAQLAYLPASWHAEENWPIYQRAYLTAQALGVADKAHDAMFEAVWRTDELGVIDRATGRPKRKLPTMEDVARFYERTTGVKAADFVKASKSFGVDLKARQADKQIVDMKIPSTPTIVVAGKYRIENNAVRGPEIVELINFLVAKEAAAAKTAAAAPAAKKP